MNDEDIYGLVQKSKFKFEIQFLRANIMQNCMTQPNTLRRFNLLLTIFNQLV